MNKEKILLFVVIAISLLLRINFEITYEDMNIDKVFQISQAKNLMIGNGLRTSGIYSNDFTQITLSYINKYAPAYPLFIIPFVIISGDYHLAAIFMDVFFVVLLYLAIFLLLKSLDIPSKKQILLFAFLGISFTPFYHLSSTDLMSLAIYQWAIYLTVKYLKNKNKQILMTVLTGLLLFFTGFIKYNYYPLIFALPFAVFIIGYIKKNKSLILFSLFSAATAFILLFVQIMLVKMLSGSTFALYEEKGIFFNNLLRTDVFPFKSFFFYEGFLTVLFSARPYLEPLYILIAASFSFLIIFEILRFVFRKVESDNLVKEYFIIGITVLFVNVLFLFYMSLTHKAQAWCDPPWTYLEETRYYSQSMLFIEIIFLTFILLGQLKTKFQKFIYKSVVFLVFAYAGIYWINNAYNIYVKKDVLHTYNGMYKEFNQINDAIKANTQKDKFNVFSSPDAIMNLFVFNFTDIQTINGNYYALLNDTVLKTDKPVVLFIASPGNDKDLKNLKKYAPLKIGGFESYDLYKTEIK